MKKLMVGYAAEIINMTNRVFPILEVGKINTMMKPMFRNGAVAMCEKHHKNAIELICNNVTKKNDLTIVLIAGPSSSGKTTLSQNLYSAFNELNYNPTTISIDDYFKGSTQCPLDEKGEYDYEHPDAVDIDFLLEQLNAITRGEKVKVPIYNFIKGMRDAEYREVDGSKNKAIIVEGIHALNPIIYNSVFGALKYKIFVNAMGKIKNANNDELIDAPEIRLFRRMIRDYKHRGQSAENTLARWESVRNGEEKHIFPFADEVDIVFNTWLPYETSILKRDAVKTLNHVTEDSKFYSLAKSYLDKLELFNSAPKNCVPKNSLLNEFL